MCLYIVNVLPSDFSFETHACRPHPRQPPPRAVSDKPRRLAALAVSLLAESGRSSHECPLRFSYFLAEFGRLSCRLTRQSRTTPAQKRTLSLRNPQRMSGMAPKRDTERKLCVRIRCVSVHIKASFKSPTYEHDRAQGTSRCFLFCSCRQNRHVSQMADSIHHSPG